MTTSDPVIVFGVAVVLALVALALGEAGYRWFGP